MILINLMVYYANLLKAQINDAACLNLARFSRYPILDFLGEYKNCKRTKAAKGGDVLQINLNTEFSYPVTINKGFQVKTNDGDYIFETTADLTIPAGETTGTVNIESQVATSEVNKYQAGEIDTVISSTYSYIENVANINGVEGGSDDETDENYIERILLSPEGFSVAGPEGAYIYFAKSAHSSIVDVSVETPEENITVKINGQTLELIENDAENEDCRVSADYQNEKVAITLKNDVAENSVIEAKIPHPYKIYIYILTNEQTASQAVLDAVMTLLSDVRPLSDYVVLQSAEISDYEINGTVYLTRDADEDIVKNSVNTYLNNYITERNNKLNRDVVRNKIIEKVCSISGVYDFNLTTPSSTLIAAKSRSYRGQIGQINFVRTDKED